MFMFNSKKLEELKRKNERLEADNDWLLRQVAILELGR